MYSCCLSQWSLQYTCTFQKLVITESHNQTTPSPNMLLNRGVPSLAVVAHFSTYYILYLSVCGLVASFPGSPPPLYFIRAIIFTRNYCAERREGESLGGFDHVRTLMTRSICPCMGVQKNEKEARISMLVGFLECSTDGSIDGQDCHQTF